jgi:hypothetical protein
MPYLCSPLVPNVQIVYFVFDWSIYRQFVLNRAWKLDSVEMMIFPYVCSICSVFKLKTRWDVNNKKWRKWCTCVSPFLFNKTCGLPVLTMGTKCTNQVFNVWLVDLQTICAKYWLETWFSPNDDIRICLFDMQRSWSKNAFWVVNNTKWRKRCKIVSLFLFNNTCALPVLTLCPKCPDRVFYIWLVDLYSFVVNTGLKHDPFQMVIFVYVCSTCSVVELKTQFETRIAKIT